MEEGGLFGPRSLAGFSPLNKPLSGNVQTRNRYQVDFHEHPLLAESDTDRQGFKSLAPSIFNINVKQQPKTNSLSVKSIHKKAFEEGLYEQKNGEFEASKPERRGRTRPQESKYKELAERLANQIKKREENIIERLYNGDTTLKKGRSRELNEKQLQLRIRKENAIKEQNMEFINMRALKEAENKRVRKHAEHIQNVISDKKFTILSQERSFPPGLQAEHKNQVNIFQKSFVAHFQKQTGYATDSETIVRNAVQQLQKKQRRFTEFNFSFKDRRDSCKEVLSEGGDFDRVKRKLLKKFLHPDNFKGYRPHGFDWRCIIESHAKGVKFLKSVLTGEVNYLRFKKGAKSQASQRRGARVHRKQYGSPRSACPRLLRALDPVIPVNLHNTSLPHFERPMQRMMRQRKNQEAAEKRDSKEIENLDQKENLKRLKAKFMFHDFLQNLDRVDFSKHDDNEKQRVRQNIQLSEDELYRQKFKALLKSKRANDKDLANQLRTTRSEILDARRCTVFVDLPILDKIDFDKIERRATGNQELERTLQRNFGLAASHSETGFFSTEVHTIPKKYRQFLTCVLQRAKENKEAEKAEKLCREKLRFQGITDSQYINEQIDRLKYKAIEEKRALKKSKQHRIDPIDFSIHLSDYSSDLELREIEADLARTENFISEAVCLEDFQGVETNFKPESIEQRRARVEQARERLRRKQDSANRALPQSHQLLEQKKQSFLQHISGNKTYSSHDSDQGTQRITLNQEVTVDSAHKVSSWHRSLQSRKSSKIAKRRLQNLITDIVGKKNLKSPSKAQKSFAPNAEIWVSEIPPAGPMLQPFLKSSLHTTMTSQNQSDHKPTCAQKEGLHIEANEYEVQENGTVNMLLGSAFAESKATDDQEKSIQVDTFAGTDMLSEEKDNHPYNDYMTQQTDTVQTKSIRNIAHPQIQSKNELQHKKSQQLFANVNLSQFPKARPGTVKNGRVPVGKLRLQAPRSGNLHTGGEVLKKTTTEDQNLHRGQVNWYDKTQVNKLENEQTNSSNYLANPQTFDALTQQVANQQKSDTKQRSVWKEFYKLQLQVGSEAIEKMSEYAREALNKKIVQSIKKEKRKLRRADSTNKSRKETQTSQDSEHQQNITLTISHGTSQKRVGLDMKKSLRLFDTTDISLPTLAPCLRNIPGQSASLQEISQQHAQTSLGFADTNGVDHREHNFLKLNKLQAGKVPDRSRSALHIHNIRALKEKHFQPLNELRTKLILNLSQEEAAAHHCRMTGYNTIDQDKPKYISAQVGRHKSYSQLYQTFQERLQDADYSGVILKNQLRGSASALNRFSRQQKWHESLNCPFYGLLKQREKQSAPINYAYKDVNLLKGYTLASQKETISGNSKTRKTIEDHNRSQFFDSQVHSLIEKCIETARIPWRHLVADAKMKPKFAF